MRPFELTQLVARAHARQAAEILRVLQVDADRGLAEHEAPERRARFGPNTIAAQKRIGAFNILFHQLQSPVVYLLAAAAALAFWSERSRRGWRSL